MERFIQKLKASCCFPIASRSQSLWEQFCIPRNARKKCVLKDFSNITEENWVLFNINQQGKELQAWTTTVLWDADLWNLESTFRSPWSAWRRCSGKGGLVQVFLQGYWMVMVLSFHFSKEMFLHLKKGRLRKPPSPWRILAYTSSLWKISCNMVPKVTGNWTQLFSALFQFCIPEDVERSVWTQCFY